MILQDKVQLSVYKEILTHGMNSIKTITMCLIGIILAEGSIIPIRHIVGYNVSSIERYSVGATCFERFELKTSQISLTAANLYVSHRCVLSSVKTNVAFAKSEMSF